MAPTATSADERVDRAVDDLAELKALATAAAAKVDLLTDRVDRRVDGLADKLDQRFGARSVQIAQLTAATAALIATNARLGDLANDHAGFEVRADHALAEVAAAGTRPDALAADYGAFKARADNTLAAVRWVGVSAATVLVGVVAGAFPVIREAATPEAAVRGHDKALGDIRKDVSDLRAEAKP